MKTKPGASIYQLKATLQGSKPPIWRRVSVPTDITPPKLHLIIQIAMGWENSHLHSFFDGEQYYGEPYPGSERRNEAGVKLNSLLRSEKDSITYEYDFGDSWQHKIFLEKILSSDEPLEVPRCSVGKRACPPEDCGGIWGYCDLLEAVGDPKHPNHEDVKEWLDEDCDPMFFDIAGINKMLAQL